MECSIDSKLLFSEICFLPYMTRAEKTFHRKDSRAGKGRFSKRDEDIEKITQSIVAVLVTVTSKSVLG